MKLAETKRFIAFFVVTCHNPRVQYLRIYDKYTHRSKQDMIRRFGNGMCVISYHDKRGEKQNIVGSSIKEVLNEYNDIKSRHSCATR